MAKTLDRQTKTLLKEHFLLRHLPAADVERLAGYTRVRNFGANQTVFLKGDPATGMMVVIEGRVRIASISPEGKEVVLNIINPGEVFGEIALIDGVERTAAATAMEETALLVMERRDFLPYLERNPELCLDLLKVMCRRIRVTSEQVEDFSFLDLKRRLAKRLVYLAAQQDEAPRPGAKAGIHFTQQELGAMTGTSRETVNKQLRAWEEEGLIHLHRGSISVVDRKGLERVIDEE